MKNFEKQRKYKKTKLWKTKKWKMKNFEKQRRIVFVFLKKHE